MSDLIDANTRKAFEYAVLLETVGGEQNTAFICKHYVKESAVYKNTDVLEFFFGTNVYDMLEGVYDAVNYIFIANKLKTVYDLLETKNSINHPSKSSCWAQIGKTASVLRDFFYLIKGGSTKKPSSDDVGVITKFCEVMRCTGNAKPLCQASSEVASMDPLDVIEGIRDGSIRVTAGGGLE